MAHRSERRDGIHAIGVSEAFVLPPLRISPHPQQWFVAVR